jgi:hypothetical protein
MLADVVEPDQPTWTYQRTVQFVVSFDAIEGVVAVDEQHVHRAAFQQSRQGGERRIGVTVTHHDLAAERVQPDAVFMPGGWQIDADELWNISRATLTACCPSERPDLNDQVKRSGSMTRQGTGQPLRLLDRAMLRTAVWISSDDIWLPMREAGSA